MYTAPVSSDKAKHTVFFGAHWEGKRRQLHRKLRREPSAEDIGDLLCGPQVDLLPELSEQVLRLTKEAGEKQSIFIAMIDNIIEEKERGERERQVILVENQLRQVRNRH